ncbi:hypothetical protein [Seonamhaeicola marinus]|uniref:Uncharacterized protein n=1 Tax=Seonamhaeicola marinus TaxID=1912246 RepID=A0A5D0IML0_9FLAO|nr:hypothetical protein [Seonamhaeicola marinus]TYA84150.1 hypothetical protein FUA24_05720 [Seonamhaeicola marinus]
METLITEQDFEPEGILNSTYKRIVRVNLRKNNKNSLFSIKRQIKNRQYYLISGVGVMLKVGLFASLLIAVFS